MVGGLLAPAGLKEKSGRALTDFCLDPGVEPRRPAGYVWSDIGRVLDADAASGDVLSGPRMGKVKSGLGRSSMGPALEGRRRW